MACFLHNSMWPLAGYMMAAAGIAASIVVVLGEKCITLLQAYKMGQPLRTFDGFLLAELHKKKNNTPTMGGILIVLAMTIAMLFCNDWKEPVTWALFGSLCVFGGIGAVDDWAKLRKRNWRGIPGRLRFSLQSLWAVGLIVSWLFLYGETIHANMALIDWYRHIMVPFMSQPLCVVTGLWWIGVVVLHWLAIVGGANSVNLTDGLDGLASGCVICCAAGMAIFASVAQMRVYVPSADQIAIVLSAMIGACAGFLKFNYSPARIFMGDTGSLALGGVLGTAAFLLNAPWFLGLCGAVFVAETLSVMIQVFMFQKFRMRPFLCSPLHHHFEYKGMKEIAVVRWFWGASFLAASLGVLSLWI